MIALKKGAKPPVLEANATAWTQSLLTKLENGEAPTKSEKARYRHPDIKAALRAETHAKCAYCESKFLHVSYGDVEHITPKSLNPELTYEWSNLTLACEICNVNKSVSEEVIDPYRENPENHLYFEGVAVFPYPGDEIGYNTERVIDLNRTSLIEARKKRRDSIYRTMEVLATTKNPIKRKIMMDFLEKEEVSPNNEYTAMTKEIINRHLARLKQSCQTD